MTELPLHFYAWTDGACSGNPGIGGYGIVLTNNNSEIIAKVNYAVPFTTNNRMELLACIEAIKLAFEKYKINILTVYTDSLYVQKGITTWIANWQNNSWKTANKKEVKNQDLWKILSQLNKIYTINWQWIKGHSDNLYNNLADKLACAAITNFKQN